MINLAVEWAAAMINQAGMEAAEDREAATTNLAADTGATMINQAEEWEAVTTNREAGMEVEMTVRAGRVEDRAEAWEVDNLADRVVDQEAWSQGLSRRECKLRKALLKRKDGSYHL